jgi:hypothetical protein
MNISQIQPFIPFLVPVLVIQLVLMISALIDLNHRPQVHGPKWVWVLIVVFVNIIGPIIYFVAGRKEE